MSVAADDQVELLSAQEVLEDAVERFHPRLYVACSFQKEASVIMDMALRIEPETRFFTLDTGVFFPETYATWHELEQRYGVRVETFDATSPNGRPWSAEHCCAERKVAALRQALADADAWVTGLRREQSAERARTPKLQYDERNGVWKANPLADWTDKDVWRYIAEHDVPYNDRHDRGYPSIGCMPCTEPGEGRDGRWADSEKTECGIHA